MMLTKKKRKIWEVIIFIATLALILTSLSPFFLYGLK